MEVEINWKLFTALVLVFMISIVLPQWEKAFGGRSSDVGYDVISVSDGFVACGNTHSFRYPRTDSDVYILKTDTFGNLLWSKYYGSIYNDGSRAIIEDNEGNFLLVGFTQRDPSRKNDVFLVKFSSEGEYRACRTYGTDKDEFGLSIVRCADGGYLIVGRTDSPSPDNWDIYVLKIDSLYDSIWTKTIGGSGWDEGRDIDKCDDGGFVIAGFTYSFGMGQSDVYLVRIDSSGDTLWSRVYGGESRDEAYSIMQLDDGGFIITGLTQSFGEGSSDIYVLRTDPDGDTIWTRTIGDENRQEANSVVVTTEGNFVVAGMMEFPVTRGQDAYLVCIDSEGELIWSKKYGGTMFDRANALALTDDEGYIFAGRTKSIGNGNNDLYIVKTDSVGFSEIADTDLLPKQIELNVFPNPFNSTCSFEITDYDGLTTRSNVLRIFDLQGKMVDAFVLDWKDHKQKNRSAFSYSFTWKPSETTKNGIYLIRVYLDDKTFVKKVLYLK